MQKRDYKVHFWCILQKEKKLVLSFLLKLNLIEYVVLFKARNLLWDRPAILIWLVRKNWLCELFLDQVSCCGTINICTSLNKQNRKALRLHIAFDYIFLHHYVSGFNHFWLWPGTNFILNCHHCAEQMKRC